MLPLTRRNPKPNSNPAMAIANANSDHPFVWKIYHKRLRAVKMVALGTNTIYSLNWFLGFCALTWATTVLLGGIVTGIAKHDYYSVTILLLLEALRLAFAHFFCFFVTRHLIYRSTESSPLDYNDYRNVVVAELLRTVGQVVALTVVSVSIILPIRRLRHLDYDVDHNTQSVSAGNFHSVNTSLWIFYLIVLTNAVTAAVGVLYSRTIVQLQFSATSDSLCKLYYDKIVWNGIRKGLFESTLAFDILPFVFEMMGDEYRHNRRAPTVMYMYSDLMLYLYEYRNHKGFEAAKVALDSADTFVREAAANIVGCWVKLRLEGKSNEQGIETLILQKKLLTKLAGALEHEETGRAATYSFEALAEQDPKAMLQVKNEQGQKLTHILMRRVHEVVEQKKYDRALLFIKVLIHLLPEEYKVRPPPMDIQTAIQDDLQNKVLELVKQQEGNEVALIHFKALFGFIYRGAPPDISKLRRLHEDLREILKSKTDTQNGVKYEHPAALKRTQAVAAKALVLCRKRLHAGRDMQDTTGTEELFKCLLLAPKPKDKGAQRIVPNEIISWWSACLLGTLARAPQLNASCEHILEDEWGYMKEVLIYLKSLGGSDPTRIMVMPTLDAENGNLPLGWRGQVVYRDIQPSNYTFPVWFKHIKITSFIVAALMLIVMGGFTCLFVLLPNFKF